MSRDGFETAALAQLPPGESSPLAARAAGAAPSAEAPAPASLGDGGAPVVIIYGTSWCGACRAARQYLTERRVPFADKDVERDPAAARELAEKAARMGIPTDRVPVIEVRGRLLQGFDRARIDALLGEPT
jgi:glutaredoxin